MGAKRYGQDDQGDRAQQLGQTWEIAQLGSFHLGKYPWKVGAWEKAFGKEPYIRIDVYSDIYKIDFT